MSGEQEGFSAREKELLAPYVTNSEGSVFALTNLPEVIKGALFSRYSRSTLGLRRLLLKEFIQDSAAEFAAISGQAAGKDPVQAARESQLAVERAQQFYDRILDGYGDDSIGELGGAHLALENVSMIATKALQDPRIGGSPLEKSTRYVSFAEKRNGDYLFYKEPTLMASPHREAYLANNRALFDTYCDLLEPLNAHLARVAPPPEGVSAAAHRRSVRARAFDSLRGLLPAATLTNMGIFGNGRFFETLLLRLQMEGLDELRGLAGEMARELGKVIPSFIRRAQPDHPHSEATHDFHAAQRALLGGLATPAPAELEPAPPAPGTPEPGGQPPGPGGVRLVDYDPDAEAKVLAGLAFPETALPLPQLRRWAAGLSPAETARIWQRLGDLRRNRRHKPPRALEMAGYTFDLCGDFGMYRDLHRHRMLTQTRQLLTTTLGYEMPEEVADAGLERRFQQMMARAAETWQAINPEFPAQAQYVVPMAYRIRWSVTINLRALMWLVELRSTPQGHPAYRRMAQQMFRAVKAVQPNLAGLMRFVDLEDYPLGRLAAEQRREEKG